jgi:crotonobetaine/carnitine-CoA ligase
MEETMMQAQCAMPLGPLDDWTVRSIAARRLAESPDRPFIQEIDGNVESYGTFIGRATALACFYLEQGIKAGDTVGVLCGNGIPALHGWMAANLIGAVDVTINANYRGDTLRHVLNVAKPALILVDADLLPQFIEIADKLPLPKDVVLIGNNTDVKLPEMPGVAVHFYESIVAARPPLLPNATVKPSAAAAVMFTSGTTGPSKGVLMPNAHVCLLAHQSIINTRLTEDDIYYCAHPLNHIAGKFMGVLAAFAMGARVVLDRRFDAERWLTIVRDHGITLSLAHGPMIEMIYATPPTAVDQDHALHRLMCCPLPKSIGEAFEKRFGLRGIEMWGMTEMTCPCWTSYEGGRPEGSCGRPMLDFHDVRIVDPETDWELGEGEVGEIVVRPRHPWMMMLGYIGMPDETVAAWRNLWFHTGDAARRDSDGNFYIVDRIKDRIRRRAENISSFDIESAALDFPGVREAAAVGVPSGMEGDDDIKLCIGTTGQLDPAALLAHLAARLPHFMVPRYIETLPALPRTPTNKVRKRDLRDAAINTDTWDRQKVGIRLRELVSGSGGTRSN